MAATVTAASLNTKGSPINAGSDSFNKVLIYTWDANGTVSVEITSATTLLSSIDFAVPIFTSGTYATTKVNENSLGTTANGTLSLFAAGAYDTGLVLVFGKE